MDTILLQILEQGLARLQQGWTQKGWAEKADGNVTYTADPLAVAWCAGGAVSVNFTALAALNETLMLEGHPPTRIVGWNQQPERTKEDVIALYERTIQRLKAKG